MLTAAKCRCCHCTPVATGAMATSASAPATPSPTHRRRPTAVTAATTSATTSSGTNDALAVAARSPPAATSTSPTARARTSCRPVTATTAAPRQRPYAPSSPAGSLNVERKNRVNVGPTSGTSAGTSASSRRPGPTAHAARPVSTPTASAYSTPSRVSDHVGPAPSVASRRAGSAADAMASGQAGAPVVKSSTTPPCQFERPLGVSGTRPAPQ